MGKGNQKKRPVTNVEFRTLFVPMGSRFYSPTRDPRAPVGKPTTAQTKAVTPPQAATEVLGTTSASDKPSRLKQHHKSSDN